MRGVLFNGKVQLTDHVEVRDPRPNEVAVRIGAAGLCHSDLSVVNGTIPFPTPVVLGHEAAGVVEEVGDQVTTLQAGDHDVFSTLSNCGLCAACDAGHPTMCSKSIGKLSKPFTVDGEKAFSFANVIDSLGWGGNCVILGVPKADAEASFLVSGMYMDKGILGCRYGSARPRHDIPMVIDLYRVGRLKLDELITRTYELDDFERALHDLEAGELARGVVTL